MGALKLNDGECLFTERRTATFRKEEYQYIHTGIINSEGEAWTTTELDEANINQIWNQYRSKHGIPFPDEIINLRKHYGLSAAKMSEILGFGINQYRYYEAGEVPNESNARIIIAIRDKKTFLEFLEASKEKVGERDYAKIKIRISSLNEFKRHSCLPDAYSGYVSYNADKTLAVVSYILSLLGGVFVTKMNKLLFYTDFIAYRRRGFGVTGLKYKAMRYGPVPENWGIVYDSLPGIEMSECILPNQSNGIKIENGSNSDKATLDDFTLQVLNDVCSHFANMTAREISLESHKEKGWIDNEATKGIINYQYAFDLNIS